jgi:hypothetical protein
MKTPARNRAFGLILLLIATLFVCRLSVNVNSARVSHASILFEHPEDPVTLSRLAGIALGLERPYSGNACINDLRQIDASKNQWALENKKINGDIVTWKDIVPYYMKERPWCPQGGVYRLGQIGEFPTCSITNHYLPK